MSEIDNQNKISENKIFVPLHTHSFYSILEASCSPDNIVKKAKELNYPAVALTDTAHGYGLVEFIEHTNKQKIKPIVGAEIFLANNSLHDKKSGLDGHEKNIVILAQTQKGYANLMELLSIASLEGFFYKPRIDLKYLKKYSEGLYILTGSAANGQMAKVFREDGETKAEKLFLNFREIFGEKNTVLEIVATNSQNQIAYNNFVLKLSEKYPDAPLVATPDSRFIEKNEGLATDILYCIGKNLSAVDKNRPKFASDSWFKSWEEICEILDYISPEKLEKMRENSLEIAESISFKMKFNQQLLPHFEVSKGETETSELRKKCEKNIENLYSEKFRENSELQNIVTERLNYELEIIGKMGFEAYFLIVGDLVEFAKKNNIAVGPGRGSAAGSIVSYLLNITTIDPIEYDLLFERFLNPERISMPDIDIDFSDERRDEVLNYVIEKYGTERVAKVATFGTLSAKAVLKDVGRAMGLEFGEMNYLTKLLPNKPGFTLADAEKISDFMAMIKSREILQKVFSISKQLEGCVRHVSVHACAVIIGHEKLSSTTPLQWSDTYNASTKITQYQYKQLEHMGLLKMDFLGLKNLSVLERTVKLIETINGEKIDLPKIPIDDKKTFEMLAQGQTTGVFQFESNGMRRYLRQLCPTEIEDLVAMNALYRPGPMEYIPQYIKGKHNPTSVKYIHKDLKNLLQKTYGIAVYQEQVLKIAQIFGGFSLGEADILRKAIGKKIARILAQQREKFISGAINKGHDEKLATKIFDEIIVPFSNYGFNRSHAVCYARIAYETAYLRANYPHEFMASLMTVDRNNTDRIVLEMNECINMDIQVLPPSINESYKYFTVVKHKQKNGETTKCLRFGLTAIKGLGEETVSAIMDEREKNGPFLSLQDLAKRVYYKMLNKKSLEALTCSGSFDEFGDRKAIFHSLDNLNSYTRELQCNSINGQMDLFGDGDFEGLEFEIQETDEDGNPIKFNRKELLQWERDSMGLFVSDHPLRGLNEYIKNHGVPINEITEEHNKETKTIHGIIMSSRKIITKSGDYMCIMTVEDLGGKIDCVSFPYTYKKLENRCFEVDVFVKVVGKVEDRNGELSILVENIMPKNLEKIQNENYNQKNNSKKPTNNNENNFDTENNTNSLDKNCGKFVENLCEIINDTIQIKIPTNATKSQINEFKKLLKSRNFLPEKGKEIAGKNCVILMNDKKVPLPFSISIDDNMEEKIREIFKL